MKYTVKNIDDLVIHESNTDAEFIHFIRNIAVENDDEGLRIIHYDEAESYLEVYCDNLTLIKN